MDELERRSLEMHREKLRGAAHSRGSWRAQPGKDW
jgi:hypothetical protein